MENTILPKKDISEEIITKLKHLSELLDQVDSVQVNLVNSELKSHDK